MPLHRMNNGSNFYYAVWGIQQLLIFDILPLFLPLFLVKNAVFCQKNGINLLKSTFSKNPHTAQ